MRSSSLTRGIKPRPPALGAQSLSQWATKKPQVVFLKAHTVFAVCCTDGMSTHATVIAQERAMRGQARDIEVKGVKTGLGLPDLPRGHS